MNDRERMDALPDELQEWLENLSAERCGVLTTRMEKQIVDTVGVWNDDTDRVLVETAFIDVAQHMHLQDTIDGLIEEGLVEVTGISEDGELQYSLKEG
jgi:hypothetical protein